MVQRGLGTRPVTWLVTGGAGFRAQMHHQLISLLTCLHVVGTLLGAWDPPVDKEAEISAPFTEHAFWKRETSNEHNQ